MNITCPCCERILAEKVYNSVEDREEIIAKPGAMLVEKSAQAPRICCSCGHNLILIKGQGYG